MRTDLHLKTQAELVADCQAYLNDTGITLASATQYKEAVNFAIRQWARRVVVPNIYAISFTAGTYSYTLPRYIKPPIQVEILTSVNNYTITPSTSSGSTYERLTNYDIAPDGNDGFTLLLQSMPYTATGRIIYFMENSVLPTGSPVVTTTITSADTSLTITLASMPELNDNGFLKVENEWIAYAGITRGSAGFTLLNLVRGVWETTAASHNSAVAVSFGVAADTPELWVQMYDAVAAYVHNLNLHKSTSEDSTRHQQLMQYHRTLADQFWGKSGYKGQRKSQMRLSSAALGPLAW